MKTCATCQKFSVQRADKEMQDQGFGCCDRREPFICFGARKERDCEHYVLAASDVIAKREAWLSGVKRVMDGRERRRWRGDDGRLER